MIQFVPLIITLLSGLAAVTFIATAGAYASRRFNFRYSYLIAISLIIYIATGYFSCVFANIKIALIINLIVEFYDATVGWKLSKKLKPNTGFTEEQLKNRYHFYQFNGDAGYFHYYSISWLCFVVIFTCLFNTANSSSFFALIAHWHY